MATTQVTQPTVQILTAFEQRKVDGINCIPLDQHHREIVYIGWNTALHIFSKYIAPLYNLWFNSFVKASSSMLNIGFLIRINNKTIIVNRSHQMKNSIKQNNQQFIALLQPQKYDKLYEILLKLLLNLNNRNFDEQSILSLLQMFVSDECEEEKKLNADAVPFVPGSSSLCSAQQLRNRAKNALQTIQENTIALYEDQSENTGTALNIEANTLNYLLSSQDVYEHTIPVVISRRTHNLKSMAFDRNSLASLSSMGRSTNGHRFRMNDNNLLIRPSPKMVTDGNECKESKIAKNKVRNKKKNSRKKKQRMKKRSVKLTQNKSNYYPLQVNEKVSDIIKTISKKMTTVIMPSTVSENKNWYNYMRKLTLMHFNDNPSSINDSIFAIKYGVCESKTNEECYHIIDGGTMIDKLFSKTDVLDLKKNNDALKIYKCPTDTFEEQLNWDIECILNYLSEGNNIKTMLATNWTKVHRFAKKNNKKRMIYQITNDEFKKKVKYEMEKKINRQDLLPIIMFRNSAHWMEWVWKFHIEDDIIIGIAFKYEESDGKEVLTVTGIHLNIERVLEQNELLSDTVKWDSWKLYKNLNEIQIAGNLDDDKNRMKSHCRNQVDMWELVINALNAGQNVDLSKLQTYQKNAQKMLEQL